MQFVAPQATFVLLLSDTKYLYKICLIFFQVLASFVAHFAAGGVLMRSYLGLLDGKFNSLTVVMAGEKGLNAPHVWLVMSGCFTALTMWKGFHFSNENLVQFPMISQTGNAQLSRQVSGLIKASFNNVVVNFKWFLLLYIIFGMLFEKKSTYFFICTLLKSQNVVD